jgi:hypothetical protein
MALQSIKRIFHPKNVESWYEKNENSISSLALIFGFILDNLSLGRVDALADKVILTIYISLAGLCILLISIYEANLLEESVKGRMHFWLTFGMQFALGGLFSAFIVFYNRSSSLESSWPFLTLLIIYFLGNEILKKHYKGLSFRVSVYFFALLSYLIIIVPTLVNKIDRWVFIFSSVAAVLLFTLFIWIISIFSKKEIQSNRKKIFTYSIITLAVINIFYFTNLIPPLPIMMRDAGVYHNLVPNSDGSYTMNIEQTNGLYDFFSSKKIFHRYLNEPVYVMTAVYSPIDLNIGVIHNWQKYDPINKQWVTTSNIYVPIKGGRQGGYRLYSVKSNVTPGLWRVNVLTADTRIIGRVKFEIINALEPRTLDRVSK